MNPRSCILVLVFFLTATVTVGRTTSPNTHTPDGFSPDSLYHLSYQRNERLYDSIQSKTSRRAVPRLLYNMLFVGPRRDTTRHGRVLDESQQLEPYIGKTIGDITIEREQTFGPNGNWFERTGNTIHILTRDRVVRRDLLFEPGDQFDPQLIVRNKQLLRSRSYISDVDITVLPDSLDSMRVNLMIRTRDSWTISVDGGLYSGGRTMVAISDANIFGTGNKFQLKTNFNRQDFSYGGNMIEYEIPNVLGTFYTAKLIGGRDFYNNTLDIALRKEFLRTTDYEMGASYRNIQSKRYLIEQDSSQLVRELNIDAWGGYAHFLAPIKSSLYFTGHYKYRRPSLRPPDVSANHHPAFHNQDVMLFGAGLYREKFYTANMVYGFGTREYLASGYKAELVSGYSWGEFRNMIYLGMSAQAGGFQSMGYIMGGFSLGSYIDRMTGMWRQSAVDVNLRWFSNLFVARRSHIRQFLALNYTQGWNRSTGNDESIRFLGSNSPQALQEYIVGTNRMVINSETVLFAPFQPLGFRIAFFGFFDVGLIGYSPNIFKNECFGSFGLGARIKNERLIFSTIQIRLGLAFGKNGLVGSDYFRISNSTRLEQYRYRPSRPEIVGFQ